MLACASFGCDEGGLTIADPIPPDDAGPNWSTEEDEGAPPESGGLPPSLDTGSGDGDGEADTGGPGPGSSVFVAPGATWRYEVGPTASRGWTAPSFDDAAWPSGPAPLGFGFDPLATVLPSGPARLRTSFELADPTTIAALLLRLRRDDGAIVWLNDVEVFRSNLGAGTDPSSKVIGHDQYFYYHAFPDPALLSAGTNVLAISLHPHPDDADDIIVDALLAAIDPTTPPDVLSFRVRTLGYDGKYGPRHVGAIWIEDANGFVRTLEVWGDNRREHLIAWRSSSDDNDVDAVTASTRSTHGTHLAEWDLVRADGSIAEPGSYRLRVEYTEANSNDNAAQARRSPSTSSWAPGRPSARPRLPAKPTASPNYCSTPLDRTHRESNPNVHMRAASRSRRLRRTRWRPTLAHDRHDRHGSVGVRDVQ